MIFFSEQFGFWILTIKIEVIENLNTGEYTLPLRKLSSTFIIKTYLTFVVKKPLDHQI